MPIILAGLSKETAISQGRLTHNNKTCDCAIEIYYQNLEELLYHDTFMNTVAQICEPTGHVFNTLNNSLYWVQHTDSLEEAIIRLQLPENKFERKSEKETLINTTYRYHLDDGQLTRKSFDLF